MVPHEVGPPTPDSTQVLADDREHFEAVYAALLAAHERGDWNDVRERWDAFDRDLRTHMDIEEERVLPAFREIDPDEADAIFEEHDDIRLHLDAFAVLVDLHAFTRADADDLAERIRDHASREESLFYPWMTKLVAPEIVERSRAARAMRR